jgi:hypothetical protein
MALLRLINIQGTAGIAVSLALGLLLILQKGETRHWKKESASYEQLNRQEQAAFDTTVADYRGSETQASAADESNAERVAVEQRAINERTDHDYEARLAAARAAAQRLRLAAQTPADRGARGDAPVPGLPAAASGSAQAADEDRLPRSDALVATEQAIQLDELIKWIREQAAVNPNQREK